MSLSVAPAHGPAPPAPSATQRARQALARDLGRMPARIGSRYFYDQRGCELFAAITRLPEYYPTRTETALLRARAADIARSVGPCACLVELGAGNCEKVRLLLPALRPDCFVGVDIAGGFVQAAVDAVARDFPGLAVWAVEADIGAPLTLPARLGAEGRLVFYPGSSIGNFDPEQSLALLRRMHALAGAGGGLLIGIDLPKDRRLLEAAYNDAAGVTAEFNRNVLLHVNRCLGSDFDPAQWAHVAFFDAAHSRVEMHLQARAAVQVRWPGGGRAFARGERIHTENSYKYPLPLFRQRLALAGFEVCKAWTDERDWCAVIHART